MCRFHETVYGSISNELWDKLSKIKLLISDVDGVLSDGKIYLTNLGDEIKSFNVRDGYGITAIQKIGINFGVITGRSSQLLENRMKSLNVKFIYQGVLNKIPSLMEIIEQLKITPSEVAYIGDDIIDLPIFNIVGLSFAPADAHLQVLREAQYKCHYNGGDGAVREVCDLLLYTHNKVFIEGASI